MSTVHLELDGAWGECSTPEACPLKFHVPGMTVAEAAYVPELVLWQMLEPFDSKPRRLMNVSMWYDRGENGYLVYPLQLHRDYGLPAYRKDDWDNPSHLGDTPPDQNPMAIWAVHGERHRAHGKPAVIYEDDSVEYWEHGVRLG